jgi:hypothetical protein
MCRWHALPLPPPELEPQPGAAARAAWPAARPEPPCAPVTVKQSRAPAGAPSAQSSLQETNPHAPLCCSVFLAAPPFPRLTSHSSAIRGSPQWRSVRSASHLHTSCMAAGGTGQSTPASAGAGGDVWTPTAPPAPLIWASRLLKAPSPRVGAVMVAGVVMAAGAAAATAAPRLKWPLSLLLCRRMLPLGGPRAPASGRPSRIAGRSMSRAFTAPKWGAWVQGTSTRPPQGRSAT